MFNKLFNQLLALLLQAPASFMPHHEGNDDQDPLMKVNNCFLATLAGPDYPSFEGCRAFLESAAQQGDDAGILARYYLRVLPLMEQELEQLFQDEAIKEECGLAMAALDRGDTAQAIGHLYEVFFPEGVLDVENPEKDIQELRDKRRLTITSQADEPVTDPSRQVLFTSNALLTVPVDDMDIGSLDISDDIRTRVNQVLTEEQLYWYDHPIPLGIAPESNEVLYGLRGLNRAVDWEKKQGNVDQDVKVTCLLSLSVTHQGLRSVGRKYLEEELSCAEPLEHLDVIIMTQDETSALMKDVLVPAMEKLGIAGDTSMLEEVFGVDGEYGRHYTFLKAVLPLWNLFVDPRVTATFKIDLDQVFPQEELLSETGKTAFQLLASPLWGGTARDWKGRDVSLGLLAGALVNQKDIHKSLFTPDVPMDTRTPRGEELFFNSKRPQALSTLAEMMCRYDGDNMDGTTTALQRIHVTGGTNGIRLSELMAFRPFTPSFVGRAEDQAYILSVLDKKFQGALLRYVHQPGLIMRHDKEEFASQAIKAASTGKLIGDYIRILYFSEYARHSTGGIKEVKDETGPFTGSFITDIPVSLTSLRLSLKAATFFEKGEVSQAHELLCTGSQRMNNTLDFLLSGEMKTRLNRERTAWDLYYDILNGLMEQSGNKDFGEIFEKGKTILDQRK